MIIQGEPPQFFFLLLLHNTVLCRGRKIDLTSSPVDDIWVVFNLLLP